MIMGKWFLLFLVLMALFFAALGLYTNLYFDNESLKAQVIDFLPPLPKIDEMKAVYLTVNTALGQKSMDKIVELVKSSELNSVVIDIKDAEKDYLNKDMKRVIKRLRFADIFPVARLPAFQHDGLAKAHPQLALKKADGALWRDSGGRFWLDPASQEVWQIILDEARQAAKMGFGEINLDYIRFPSDGKLSSVIYPVWDKKISRSEIIKNFSQFMKDGLKQEYPDVKLTADVFGYLLLRDDDQGIGQSITELAKIFDFVYPMVYPSHYDSGNFNFDNPATHPYEIVFQSLEKGKKIFEKHQQSFVNVRPWIQDFDLGAIYTPEMVRLQMKATEDAGLKQGWLVWNPNNRYRQEIFALDKKIQ